MLIDNSSRRSKTSTASSSPSEIVDLALGDVVFLHASNNYDQYKVRGKYDPNWIGPYIITSIPGSRATKYILTNPSTGKVTKPVHRRYLRKAQYDPQYAPVPTAIQRKVDETKENIEAMQPLRRPRVRRVPQQLLQGFRH
mmetsp:Transcript_22285/g.33214  ORF Transcript_22285/g.33214 Transcript_22285/m.33214 type:complete len:140 (+) Transcript_22285:1639-2058(+)